MASEPEYPKRPPFFALALQKTLMRDRVALEIGAAGCLLLLAVASAEDDARYRGPVSFWNEQLMGIAGFGSEPALIRARAACIAAGWLAYAPGGNRRPGRYYVTVPNGGEAEGATGAGVESSTPEIVSRTVSRSGAEPLAEAEPNGSQSSSTPEIVSRTVSPPFLFPNTEEEERAHSPNTSAPIRKTTPRTPKGDPGAVPIPPALDTPEFRTIWGDWLAERSSRRKPLTERAARLQLGGLEPLGPSGAAACVKASIANGWQGLFPEKFRDQSRPPGATPRPSVPFDPRSFEGKFYTIPTPTENKA